MDRLLTIDMFIAVSEQGGFAAAARALRTSPAAVTRGIAELEARLGIMLFHRSTRAVSLTDAGAAYLPKARAALADLVSAERELVGGKAEPSGELVITAPVFFGRLHVVPAIAGLIEAHPALRIRALFVDRNIRMVEEGIDIALRIGELPDSAMKAVKIGEVRPVMVASPAYLERHGTPRSAEDLLHHRLVATTGPRGSIEWRCGAGRDIAHKNRPRLTINSVDAMLAAAEAGVGLVNLLSYQVEDAVAQGRLVRIDTNDGAPPLPIHLLFEASRSGNPATRAFIDAMRSYAAERGWG
jgi:DNA-binding transcriptional LysR family regulator